MIAPAVDVVIPLHNKAAYVEQAIRSVLEQSCPVRQLFVCDDASSDDGPDIVVRLSQEDPRVVFVKSGSPQATGPSAARNRGIALCEAEFVAFLDADDWWDPDKLERQLIYFADPDIGLVHCGTKSVDAAGVVTGQTLPPPEIARSELFDAVRLGTYPVTGSASASVVRRSLLDEVGGFPEHSRFGEDWDLWARLSGRAGFKSVAASLANIRTLPTYARTRSAIDEYLLWLRVFDRWSEDKRFMRLAIAEARRRMVPAQVGVFWKRRFWDLFFALPLKVRTHGGPLGKAVYPSLFQYWWGLRHVFPHIVHPIVARLRGAP